MDSTYDAFTDRTTLTVKNNPMLQLNQSAFFFPVWSCDRNAACVLDGFEVQVAMAADPSAASSSEAAHARWNELATSTLLKWDFMVLRGGEATRFTVSYPEVLFYAFIVKTRTIVARTILNDSDVIDGLLHGTGLRIRQQILSGTSAQKHEFEVQGASAWLLTVQGANRRLVEDRGKAAATLIAVGTISPPQSDVPAKSTTREDAADSAVRKLPYFDFEVEKAATAIPGSGEVRYPKALKKAGVEGDVLVQFIVDTAGRAELGSFKVLRASNEGFGQAVEEALPRMRFVPAEIGGRKVRMRVEQPFAFALNK